MALIIAISGIGGILYLQVSKPFFTDRPNMVFVWIAIFDIIVLVFILLMIWMGKYGDVAPQEDTFGEGNSQKNEKATADFMKEDHEFDDDIPDVPLYQDIYNEQIPEMSSDFEASSFHTKRFPLEKSGRLGSQVSRDDNSLIGTVRQTVSPNNLGR